MSVVQTVAVAAASVARCRASSAWHLRHGTCPHQRLFTLPIHRHHHHNLFLMKLR